MKTDEYNKNWIKLYRKIMENPMYFSEPFTKMQAWIDMLLIANHEQGYFYVRGIKVDIYRGQIGYTQDNLAIRWKWSRGKVIRYLNMLEKEGMIVQQKSKLITLISITKYGLYQENSTTNSTTNGTTNSTTSDTTNGTQTRRNKEESKKNKETEEKSSEFDFVVNEWFEYKKERIESYKSEKAKAIFVNKLKKLSDGDAKKARDIIEQSMANNWAGIFELKNNKETYKKPEASKITFGGRDDDKQENKKDTWQNV